MNERAFLFWDAPLIGWLQSEWAIFYTVKNALITVGCFSDFVLLHFYVLVHYFYYA